VWNDSLSKGEKNVEDVCEWVSSFIFVNERDLKRLSGLNEGKSLKK
jgi:hypothetical protein